MNLPDPRTSAGPVDAAQGRPSARSPRWRLRQWIGLVLIAAGLLGITPMWGFLHPGESTSMLHFVGATLMTLAGVVVFTFERLPPAEESSRRQGKH